MTAVKQMFWGWFNWMLLQKSVSCKNHKTDEYDHFGNLRLRLWVRPWDKSAIEKFKNMRLANEYIYAEDLGTRRKIKENEFDWKVEEYSNYSY